MRDILLLYLVCPACGAEYDLAVNRRAGGHVMEGSLRCRGCGSRCPIEEGVPVILEPSEVDKRNQRTAERFGYEWEAFNFISETYERQFLDWIWPVEKSFFADKVVLDAGCGKGRHAILAARFGARQTIGVDLAAGSVRAAFRNTHDLPNVHIVRADLYRMPFREGSFDYTYSIGVLHHTPRPGRAVRCLAEKLRRGGTVSVWVYGKEGNRWIVSVVNPVRQALTSKLPLVVTRIIALLLATILHPVLKLVYRPVNEAACLRPLSRWLFYNDYLYYISAFSFRENYSIVFDHLLPEIAHYVTRDEVVAWFVESGLKDILVTPRTNNSWRGKGEKA